MSGVKRNIIANYLGSIWTSLMGLAFIPLYIHFLGNEFFGLIGVFVSLQAWLSLLDMGLTATLNRELSRFLADKHTSQSIQNLIFSIEIICIGIALLIVIFIVLSASWLSSQWLNVEQTPIDTVINALKIMSCIVALNWMSGLYRSAIMGLEKQLWLNMSNAFFATLRHGGVIGVMIWIEASIEAFFIYHGIISTIELLALKLRLKHYLPQPAQRIAFCKKAIKDILRFAMGMATITFLSLLLLQLDKLILSKLLPLAEFGFYTLAWTTAASINIIVRPIATAVLPRFTRLVEQNEITSLSCEYHHYAQLLSILLIPFGLILAFFSESILFIWTQDNNLASKVAPIVSVLAIGNLFNGMMNIPYMLQLSYGWTQLSINTNFISVIFLAPAVYIAATNYGMLASASIWTILNLGYILIAVPLMHKRLLVNEKWQWYVHDFLLPGLMSLIVIGSAWYFSPKLSIDDFGSFQIIAMIFVTGLTAFFLTLLATPLGRNILYSLARQFLIRMDK